jgi:hypothetical protein
MGPGKYDALATKAREEAMAAAVLLIVIGGNKGSGFSVQTADLIVLAALPAILRDLANDIEASGGRA